MPVCPSVNLACYPVSKHPHKESVFFLFCISWINWERKGVLWGYSNKKKKEKRRYFWGVKSTFFFSMKRWGLSLRCDQPTWVPLPWVPWQQQLPCFVVLVVGSWDIHHRAANVISIGCPLVGRSLPCKVGTASHPHLQQLIHNRLDNITTNTNYGYLPAQVCFKVCWSHPSTGTACLQRVHCLTKCRFAQSLNVWSVSVEISSIYPLWWVNRIFLYV